MKTTITTISLLYCLLVSNPLHSQTCYEVVYEADKEGKKVAGSLEKLNEHVKAGTPIRIGWVLKFVHPLTSEPTEMEHWADASFITLLDGHVFTQVQSIYEQGPSFDSPPSIYLTTGKPN